jgi:hypothetical protein
MFIALTGALAGLFHVLSGPDHLAAVAPLAVEDGRRGWLSGWTWGLGHASGVVVVALLAIALRDLFPPIGVISAWSERVVVALIGIGLWALRRSTRIARRTSAWRGGAQPPSRAGRASLGPTSGPRTLVLPRHPAGVAGSSHFLGVLPALALPTRVAAVTYIGSFGVGTVVAMTAFAAVIGAVGGHVRHGAALYRGMMRAAAVLAIAVGGVWLMS